MIDHAQRDKLLGVAPGAARWLRSQEGAIVPPWISAIQDAVQQIPVTPNSRQMENTDLIQFFDGVVAGLETGDLASLEAALQTLVADRLGRGYALTDFLHIAAELKSAIWRSARSALSSEQALSTLAALEPIFSRASSRLAWFASRAARIELEEELERTRHNLAKLDRVKSDFISIAAHELKTPLTLVQGYTAILSSNLNEQQHLNHVVNGLNKGVKRLHALIQDMIDVSLIDSDVLTIAPQRTSLYEILRMAIDDLEQETADRHLMIEIERFPEDVNGIYLDAKRIYQVFTNLVGNAVKYTPDGGRIHIGARMFESTDHDLRFVEIAITDTGIGIAADDLSHIFQKFYRIGDPARHSTSKTQFKGGGPGLGLAVTKGIVEAHGGRIWAESPGFDEQHYPGSTFRVMLPVHKELPISPSARLLGLEGEQPPYTRSGDQ